MVCGGLRWFVVVCGGLWWIAVVCLLVIPPSTGVSVNTEIGQSPSKYTEIHDKASICLPKYTHN